MREYKFRAWNKEEKIMCYEDEDNSACYLDGWCASYVQIINQTFNSELIKEDYDFMQYTGLHDKNGKEIYEGDIVKRSLRDKEDDRIFFEDFYVIIFEKATFQYKGIREYYISKTGEKWGKKEKKIYRQNLGSNFGVNIKDIEVIGNIYDNPELLEKGE